jgi:hypothetical protein
MKRLIPIVMAAALAVSLAAAASAQPGPPRMQRPEWRGRMSMHAPGLGRPAWRGRMFVRAPGLERREWRQHLRIRRGVLSGRLTPREAGALRMRQHAIRGMEWRARRDGALTMRERFRMDRALDRQSLRIWRLKHNGRWI